VGVGVGVGEGSGLGLGLGVGFLSAAIAGANDPTVRAAASTQASLLDRPHPPPWFMDLSSLSGEGSGEASKPALSSIPASRIGESGQHMAAGKGTLTGEPRESLPYEQPLVLPQVPQT
jgi:hypothetical protein